MIDRDFIKGFLIRLFECYVGVSICIGGFKGIEQKYPCHAVYRWDYLVPAHLLLDLIIAYEELEKLK